MREIGKALEWARSAGRDAGKTRGGKRIDHVVSLSSISAAGSRSLSY